MPKHTPPVNPPRAGNAETDNPHKKSTRYDTTKKTPEQSSRQMNAIATRPGTRPERGCPPVKDRRGDGAPARPGRVSRASRSVVPGRDHAVILPDPDGARRRLPGRGFRAAAERDRQGRRREAVKPHRSRRFRRPGVSSRPRRTPARPSRRGRARCAHSRRPRPIRHRRLASRTPPAAGSPAREAPDR